MGSLTCKPPCGSNPAVALASMPCFLCTRPAET
jgi:hypothetical protein